MFAGNFSQNNDSPSCVELIKNWWKGVPYFNRSICLLCICLYIISFPFTEIITYGINQPKLTIEKIQLWRILTATFIHTNILQLLFCLISLLSSSSLAERAQGSAIFIFNLLIEAVLIQTLFTALAYSFNFVLPQFAQISSGLWSLVMLQIALRSFQAPDEETNFLCFPVKIKQKYYPWLILLFFSFFSAFQIIDLFSGIIIAFIEIKLFHSQFLTINSNKIQTLEDKLFKQLSSNESFIKIANANSGSLPFYQGIQGSDNEVEENNNLLPFSGKGIQIVFFYFTLLQKRRPQKQNITTNKQQPIQQQNVPQQSAAFSGKGIMLGTENHTEKLINQTWQENYGTQ